MGIGLPRLDHILPLLARPRELGEDVGHSGAPPTLEPEFVQKVRDAAEHQGRCRLRPVVLQALSVRVHDDGHDLLDRRGLDIRPRWDELEGPFAFEVGGNAVPEPEVRQHLLQRVERSPCMPLERRRVREVQPQDLLSQLPFPVARRQREILSLDVQDKGALPPAVQQRGQDQTDPLSAPRRGEAEDVFPSVVAQHQGFLQKAADDDAAHDDALLQRLPVF